MYALLTLDVARDAVAEQFAYGEPLASVVEADDVAPRTRSALAGLLHRVADLVAPPAWGPAH
jgi:hypothetical protein